ncbi:MAG: enoyl-CoA hydratase, partial [Ilumatobacteraceae bacterium]|nr:enoyl-CoA hydratase [Ilumatobacteraceae bacterium]
MSAMAGTDLVRRDLDQGVLLLTWNRPERNNGWTVDLEDAYFEALIAASADRAVRVIVVTGAGRTFCPGLDMQTLSASATSGTPMANRRRWPMNFVRHVPKPVIAAVNGACAGIGFIQAVACDMRFASTSAKFTSAFARRGLPAENSISWMLPRLIGTGKAMDLLLSARVVMPDEALRIGLVDRLVEPDDLLTSTL